MTTKTWIGGSSTTWNNKNNWSDGILPADGDTIIINTSSSVLTFSTNRIQTTFDMKITNGTLWISTGGYASISNLDMEGGSIIINNSGQTNLLIKDGLTGSPTATVTFTQVSQLFNATVTWGSTAQQIGLSDGQSLTLVDFFSYDRLKIATTAANGSAASVVLHDQTLVVSAGGVELAEVKLSLSANALNSGVNYYNSQFSVLGGVVSEG